MAEAVAAAHNSGGVRLVDRYLLRLTLLPMAAAMGVTLVALLLERILRLLDLLSESSNRFGFVAGLAANLVPHYLGLTLPAGFFIALFIVVSKLNEGSEIDALLASGVSMTRIAAPLIALGAVLMALSLLVYGFAQPYSRYAYRGLLHAAQNAGWSGMLQAQTFVSPNASLTLTADGADPAGRKLQRVFIRRVSKDGRELITTARTGEIYPNHDGRSVTLELRDGQELTSNTRGDLRVLGFSTLSVRLPLVGAAKLLRARGGDERELTLFELVAEAAMPRTMLPRQTVLAELLGRLARALILPLLPLLALPLGMSAKRGGRTPGILIAGFLLLAFQHLLQFGQSLTTSGRALALPAVGAPFAVFVAISVLVFVSSRKRPGETPIGRFAEEVAGVLRRLRPPKRRLESQA